MDRKLVTLAFLMAASLAFGQSQTTNSATASSTHTSNGSSSSSTQRAPDTAVPPTSNDVVTVDSFASGSRIIVSSTPISHPTTYALGKDVQIVDESGKTVDPNMVRAGTRVRLEVTGDDRHVGRITVIGAPGGK